ncbi:hypothetical protein DK867_11735 [Ochrobactrum sp. POC9]|nr:hypothetical protein DK867_11735 [Ochrobactrum sp. POC9]
MGGHRKRILEPHRDIIVQRLAENPHLTLHGLKAALTERGMSVSHNTIWEFRDRAWFHLHSMHTAAESFWALEIEL